MGKRTRGKDPALYGEAWRGRKLPSLTRDDLDKGKDLRKQLWGPGVDWSGWHRTGPCTCCREEVRTEKAAAQGRVAGGNMAIADPLGERLMEQFLALEKIRQAFRRGEKEY